MNNEEQQTNTQQEISNLATALAKAQAVMSGAKKDKKNPFFKSSYADLAAVFDAVREPFAANGLAITQTMDIHTNGNQMVLCTRLMHASGEHIDSKMLLPVEPNPQKLGSLITYYRRYSLMAIAGVPAEDDDGNQASGKVAPAKKYITPEQVMMLEKLMDGNNEIRDQVLNNCNNNLASITIDRYPGAVEWVNQLLKESEEL